MMASKNINDMKTQAVQDGMHIQPVTTADHRKLTSIFDEVGTQYHTYRLPEEKPLMSSFAPSWRRLILR